MSQRKTNQEFVRHARAIHGRRYDYSRSQYRNNSTKLTVVCRIHGPFMIFPSNHLKGQGCRPCGMAKQHASIKKPFDVFVREARKLHGRRYRYSKGSYRGARSKMRITCAVHGVFLQSPEVHLRPSSCRQCAAEEQADKRRLTIEGFRSRLRTKYGSRISYRGRKWAGLHGPIYAECFLHGRFKTLPTSLLYQTHGCRKCALNNRGLGNRLSQHTAIKRLRQVFGNRYDLSRSRYSGSKKRMTLNCAKHGAFKKAAEDLFRGSGCARCAYEEASAKRIRNLRKHVRTGHHARLKSFLSQAHARHGDRYDYSKMKFTTQRAPIIVGCPVHGFMQQVAYTHLQAGCRKCADAELKGRYSAEYFRKHPDESTIKATIYYVYIEAPGESFYKVGITKTSIGSRFSHLHGLGGRIHVLAELRTTLARAFQIEQQILKEHCSGCSYRPKLREAKRGSVVGATECFTKPIPQDRRYFTKATRLVERPTPSTRQHMT